MPRQKLGLQMPQKADRHSLVEKGVLDLVALALLVGDENRLAALIGKQNGAVFEPAEISGGVELAAIYQRQRQAVGKAGTKFLHKVKGEAWAAGPVAVKEAHSRVEADGLQRRTHVMGKERIDERQKRVYPVKWWAARAAHKLEFLFVSANEVIENRKVYVTGFALRATQFVYAQWLFNLPGDSGEAFGCAFEPRLFFGHTASPWSRSVRRTTPR